MYEVLQAHEVIHAPRYQNTTEWDRRNACGGCERCASHTSPSAPHKMLVPNNICTVYVDMCKTVACASPHKRTDSHSHAQELAGSRPHPGSESGVDLISVKPVK